MSDLAEPMLGQASPKPNLDANAGPATAIIFIVLLAGGLLVTVYGIYSDISESGVPVTTYLPFLLLGVALLIALAFEFVNGFHDTANAVATVIYTHSLPAQFAVVWSGFFNFLGVLVSSGAVAFGIISLLPVELILQVGSGAGFAMVFALLFAAIIWNLGTWWLGLPASSSHTLIGSIIGVGITNALLRGRDGTSGVDWGKAIDIGYSLLLSPLVGFVAAALAPPRSEVRPSQSQPLRGAEGQSAPAVVDSRHSDPDLHRRLFRARLQRRAEGHGPYHADPHRHGPDNLRAEQNARRRSNAGFRGELGGRGCISSTKERAAVMVGGDPRPLISTAIALHEIDNNTLPAVGDLVRRIAQQVEQYGSVAKVPVAVVANVRNDMYLASEAVRFILKDNKYGLSSEEVAKMKAYKASVDDATRFIPLWVKVAVAIALGLGTMIGWKRIVVTVGEKIGKQHLTYAQGASAELVAMTTIFAADIYGLPVSTTHVLSSGVAGAMAANKSGLQFATIRNLLMAWVLTLPMAIIISGSLFYLFTRIF